MLCVSFYKSVFAHDYVDFIQYNVDVDMLFLRTHLDCICSVFWRNNFRALFLYTNFYVVPELTILDHFSYISFYAAPDFGPFL